MYRYVGLHNNSEENRWVENFKELVKRPVPQDQRDTDCQQSAVHPLRKRFARPILDWEIARQ